MRQVWKFSCLLVIGTAFLTVLATGTFARFYDHEDEGDSGATSRRVARLEQASHQRMLGVLKSIALRSDDRNSYVGDLEIRRLEAAIQRATPDNARPDALITAHMNLANGRLRIGEIDVALAEFDKAERLVKELDPAAQPRQQALLDLAIGIAWFRKGEVENCLDCCTGESCTWPIAASARHQKPEGSKRAIARLEKVLRVTRPSEPIHLQVQWLLNLAHMTLGTWPDGVRAEWLIDVGAVGGDASFPPFKNIARERGFDVVQLAGGIIVEDFDGDRILDVLTTTFDPKGLVHFWRGTNDGRFVEATEDSGLEGFCGGGLHVTHADFDNDGDFDVFVPRGAWLRDDGRSPCSLLRNDGTGHFTDVTFAAGLGAADYPTQVAAWSDFDLDGDLDLFVGMEADPVHPYASQLWRNEGDGTFVDVAEKAGVTNDRYSKGAAWGDYDGDRWPDLYVSNLSGDNRLYRNQRDGTFLDVAPMAGVTRPIESFPCWFWDFNQDGNLDIYVNSYEQDIGGFVAARYGRTGVGEAAALYAGDGKGGFKDVAVKAGVALPMVTMGASFGDFENDGYQDMYLGTGFPGYEGLVPNLVFRNLGGQSFENVTGASRMGHLQKGHAIAFADFDDDGDEDIFVRLGGAFRADTFGSALYENPGFGGHWIKVRLDGVESNRAGVGSRILVVVGDGKQERSIWRWMGQVSSFGSTPYTMHIGIGQAERVRRIEVFWPKTGKTQVFENLPVDRSFRFIEDEPHAIEFGRSPP